MFKLFSLIASLEKSSGKIITEDICPLDKAVSAFSESLNSLTLKGKDLDMALIAWVDIKGKDVLVSRLTIPSLKFDEIFSGSLGAVRLNIEKINAISVGTIIAALNSLLRRKSLIEEGINLNQIRKTIHKHNYLVKL